MTHHNNNAWPGVEVFLKCTQCVEVKIVRGFVKKQDVGLFNKCEKKLQASAFATRQSVNGRKLCIAIKPELAHEVVVFN